MKKFSQALAFYSIAPFLYFFSILPWWVLFLLSDIAAFVLYNIVGYRRKVVWLNLKNSFPEKSDEELKLIEIRFYRHFTDIMIEVLKMFTLSPRQKLARCEMDIASIELLNDLYSKKRSAILVMGHYGNWEYYPYRLHSESNHQPYAIYHPLSNTYINKALLQMRTRTGCKLYTMSGAAKGMINNQKELNLTLFLADQAPAIQGAYWMKFMNQDAPVFNGSEKIAQKLGMAVIYGSMEHIQRGRYVFHATLICEDASLTKPGEITESHIRMLEADIRKTPEFWLWSHRRWKHKKPVGI